MSFYHFGNIDVNSLNLDIKRQSHLWNKHRMRKDREGSPHADMDDIWLRYNDLSKFESPYDGINDEHDSIWYPAAYSLPSAWPIIFNLMAAVKGERLGGVLITKIPPGGEIKPHTDDTWHVRYYDKFYVSLESDVGANFYCQTKGAVEMFCPRVGDVYWFDNTVPHWVKNESDGNRTTLIVCIRTHKFEARYAG